MKREGRIVSVKRFEIHDGEGIRTTVFLKGCPLQCLWCHNPESLSSEVQISFQKKRCVNCGKCTEVCERHCFINGEHIFQRSGCINCGKCVSVCPTGALDLYGRKVTVDELLPELLEDRRFYESSHGGVTISGGEPLMQADFSAELLKELKREGINTAVDTSCHGTLEQLEKLMPWTDTFLVDIKAMDDRVHQKCTGVSNRKILENILYLDAERKSLEIRIPYVPGWNDTDMEAIAIFCKSLRYIKRVKILPYHDYGWSKYITLGKNYPAERMRVPKNEEIEPVITLFQKVGLMAENGAQ